MRVFIAVDIEDPLVISRLDLLKDAILSTGVPMKTVESYNYHITLRFIGEVPEGVVDAIKRDVLGGVRAESFTMKLQGLGAFPSPARPRVVWVGVTQGADELGRIRETIESRLRKLGIKPERQEFHPHVTLARIKGSRNIHSLVRVLQEYQDYEVGIVRVTAIRLKKSTLTRRGPIYETLWEVKLA